MSKRYSVEWHVLGFKMGLIHELTSMIIENGEERRNKKLGRNIAYCIARMSEIKTYDRNRARIELLEVLREAHTHVVIFNSVTTEGWGRQTKWKEIWFEQMEELQEIAASNEGA